MNFDINKYIVADGFDAHDDKIAIVLKEFTLRKNPDWPFRYSEPYIISMAIDQGGANNPAIDFNILPFPKAKKGDVINFDGQGHLIYGPANPGEFVVYTILFMESDQDMRDLGRDMEGIIKSEAAELGMKEILSATPTFSTTSMLLLKLSELVATKMKSNRDDELYRRNGTLLRDVPNPYNISEMFEGSNDFIKSKVTVVPLTKNLQAPKETKTIEL